MPIYEYSCKKCGEFEVTQRITDKPLAKCPTCRAKVTKLISSTSFHLKGSGWYITDYGRGGSKDKSAASESKSESNSSAKSSESKSSDTTSSESKSSDTTSSESKSTETKTPGSKSSETKSSGKGTKAASTTSAAA